MKKNDLSKYSNDITDVEYYFSEQFDIKLNQEIYDLFTDCGSPDKGLFKPLHFFNLLYYQLEYIKANKSKPISVVKHLKQIPISDIQREFLFIYIHNILFQLSRKNKNNSRSNSDNNIILDKELDNMADRIYREKQMLEIRLNPEAIEIEVEKYNVTLF